MSLGQCHLLFLFRDGIFQRQVNHSPENQLSESNLSQFNSVGQVRESGRDRGGAESPSVFLRWTFMNVIAVKNENMKEEDQKLIQ